MAIKLYNPKTELSPWREFDVLTNRLGRFFDDPFSLPAATAWYPAVNVEETPEDLVLTAEIPGLTEKEIDIELDNNILTISGEKREEREEGVDNGRFHLFERRYGTFRRSFTLPRTVNAKAIEAVFEKGVLTVRMPKSAEAKTKKIPVKVG
jgi:HSP20 family protein